MSTTEIHYIVPEAARPLDDTETILNAIGSFQETYAFHVEQEATVDEQPDGSVFIRLILTPREPRPDYELREAAEKMRLAVEQHFPAEDHDRLSSHFAGIAIADVLKTE